MSTHPYGLRSKFSNQGVSVKTTPSNSPLPKSGARSPRKFQNGTSLSLRRVIGTTTSTPSGFSSHAPSNTFAYCAGSTAVLATVDQQGQISQRFYKARPTSGSLNPYVSFYESSTPNGSPRNRRMSVLPSRQNGYGSTPGGSPFREHLDDNTQTWTARERIKAATSVSLSPDGKMLAVGETGYSPRVLIFSTAKDAPCDLPLSIMSEHSFGVRAVAFSPDSRYLASLGDVNDGFLFIYALNPKTGAVRLHSTNKCKTNVYDMTWCGNNLVTVGVRHIKIWRVSEFARQPPPKGGHLRSDTEQPASPAPAPLSGRNCLLGSLSDSTFISIAAVSDQEAVVCTDSGQICVLDFSEGGQELKILKRTWPEVSCVAANPSSGKVFLGAKRRRVVQQDFNALKLRVRSTRSISPLYGLSTSPPCSSSRASSQQKPTSPKQALKAVGYLAQGLVTVDNDSNVRYLQGGTDEELEETSHFAGHSDSVQGLQLLPKEDQLGCFYTWSRSGSVKFWDSNGALQRAQHAYFAQEATNEEESSNELVTMHYVSSSGHFVSGDRFGVLKVIRNSDWATVQDIRLHAASICDIDSHQIDDKLLVATCGRDRMVQLLSSNGFTFELVQTMDDHVGAVNRVLFTHDGEKLLSSSSDRTVIIRNRMKKEVDGCFQSAYLSSRVVTMKATPISIALIPDEPDVLAISTMDRHVARLSLSSGSIVDSFKVADPENDDTVVLSSISVSRDGMDSCPRLLVGYSSIDKSVRVYDLNNNVLLARDSGHTEGISDVVLLEEETSAEVSSCVRTVISTGLDGTVMMWNLTVSPFQPVTTPLLELSQSQGTTYFDPGNGLAVKASPVLLPPLRKVLSKNEIAEFSGLESPHGPPLSNRDRSPVRTVRRKPSRLTTVRSTSTILEQELPHDEAMARTSPPPKGTASETKDKSARQRPIRSPSPPIPTKTTPRVKKQRSHTENLSGLRSSAPKTPLSRRSPSPPPPAISATSNSTAYQSQQLRNRDRANHSRPLRRPPSIPSNLRSVTSSFGAEKRPRKETLGLDHDHDHVNSPLSPQDLCRALQSLQNKLKHPQEPLDDDLDHFSQLEFDLEQTLKLVRRLCGSRPKEEENVEKDTETDMDLALQGGKENRVPLQDGDLNGKVEQLATLLQRTAVG